MLRPHRCRIHLNAQEFSTENQRGADHHRYSSIHNFIAFLVLTILVIRFKYIIQYFCVSCVCMRACVYSFDVKFCNSFL